MIPRTLSDGRIVVNELCRCGALRTEHSGPIGHGFCERTNCSRFSWAGHIFAPVGGDAGRTLVGNTPTCEHCGEPEHDCCCCDCPKCLAHRWDDAGRDAGGGPDLPAPPTPGAKFAVAGANVVMVDQTIATARSKTMALRIANALNKYVVGRRGY